MTDHRTEQGAADFWRQIDARIDKRLGPAINRQTGIVPGTAYGSVIFDAAGRAVWGGAGGGGGTVLVRAAQHGGSDTIASGTNTRINYSTVAYDPLSIVTTTPDWQVTLPYDGWYRMYGTVVLRTNGNDWPAGKVARMWFVDESFILDSFYLWSTTSDDFYLYLQGEVILSGTTGDHWWLSVTHNTLHDRVVDGGGANPDANGSDFFLTYIGPSM